MSEAQKDTIYVDVDDEITSVVEKISASKSKIVALVLPKRAVVLHSVINMKLLKRASDDANKRVVLITSEKGLMPLAGVVGVYVAKNLQSKPEIPPAPDGPQSDDELLEAEEANQAPAKEQDAVTSDETEAVFESDAPLEQDTKQPKSDKKAKAKKAKKNKVPNFDSFRKKIIIGVVAFMVVIVLAYVAFFVAPKANIIIKTENSITNSSIDFTASPSAQSLDVDKAIAPSKEAESTKNDTQKAPATGQKDLGTKASGSVTLSVPCSSVVGTPPSVPAGTGVSNNGLTFITANSTSLTNVSFVGGCKFSGNTNVTAQANGDQYNLESGKSFTVAGFSSVSGTNSTAFTGGTSKMAKVVSQQDIETAKQKLTDSSDEVKQQLKKQLEDAGYYAITDTFAIKSEKVSSSPNVDQEASEVTVTAERVYVMTGVKQEDLRKLVEHDVKSELDERSLQIQDDGLGQTVFKVGNRKDNGNVAMTMQTQVVMGPKIDEDQLKKDVAGKKRGDVKVLVKKIDGVSDADVKFSPFWVNIVPKNTQKITIIYEEANK